MKQHGNGWAKGCVLAVTIVMAAGCAAQQAYTRAQKDSRRENWDAAVLGYSKALALDPGNTRYGVALERAKLKASAEHFQKGKRYAQGQQWELAAAEYQQTILLNPGNQYAQSEMEKAMVEIERRTQGPSELEAIKERARRDALAPPKLSPKSNIPILLQFRDQPVGKILEGISKASQINFIFDDKVDLNKPMTIDIGNVTMEKALDILMLQTKNFYKVIDENTLLIAPDQRQKRQELEDQVIRTFYLSNGETKQVVSVLRTLLNARQVAENDTLNAVTIKDTPDKVAIAERIVDANDKSKGEVIVDVELLEINRTVAQNLGIDLSTKTLVLRFQDGDRRVELNNTSQLKQKGNWSIGPIPSVVISFLKTDSDSKVIAKPQLRVTEGEKAEVLIGNRVPIPTTSFNTSQTVGGNIVPITSFTYQNVGITLGIEPRVHHNKEITLKVKTEVSQIAGYIEVENSAAQPIIGTRQIETTIRLRDGETNLLAGLIRREDQDSRSGIPGLIDTPGIGRIFSNTKTDRQETDIILTLTPYIVRIPDITEDDLSTLWVGTEENMRLRGPVRGVLGVSPFAPDVTPDAGGAAEPSASSTGASLPPLEEGTGGGGIVASSRAPGESPAPDVEPEPVPEPPAPPGEFPGEDTPGMGVPPVAPPGDSVDEGGQQDDAGTQEPSGPATVRMVASAASYRVGELVTVEVRIENASNVGSVPFHLQFNRQVLEYVGPAVEGPFLSSDGLSTVFYATPSQGGTSVVVGASRLGGGEGVSGAGAIATFQFQAVNPGDAGFAFTGASVKDPQARNLPANFIAAPVRVEP